MNKIEWIFFDLDGTLVDSLDAMYNAYLEFLKDNKIQGNREEFERLNGPSLKEITAILKKKYRLDQDNKELFESYERKIKKAYQEKIKPFKNSSNLLKTLKRNGFNLALVTSSTRKITRSLIKRNNWEKYFSNIVYGDEVVNSKPHPQIYNICCERTKADKKKILVVEDSKNGFLSAKRAGLKCILINNGKDLLYVKSFLGLN